MKRFKIELLATVDGVNFGSFPKLRRSNIVVILLWCGDKTEARDKADRIAKVLFYKTYIGNIEYRVKSVRSFSRHPVAEYI